MRILFSFFLICSFLSAKAQTAIIAPAAESNETARLYIKAKKEFEHPKPGTSGKRIAESYRKVLSALGSLNEPDQYDELLRIISTKYADNPYVLANMAFGRGSIPSYGYRIGNKFTRGNNRSGTGESLSCQERDRIFMAKLMLRAMYNAKEKLPDDFYIAFAGLFPYNSSGEMWKLQNLTDLYGKLPDYSRPEYIPGLRPPVHPDGSPVFYSVPASFEAAKNDGERVRFLLSKAGEKGKEQYYFSLKDGFDPSQVSDWCEPFRFYRRTKDGLKLLNSLSDDETLAWLANGVQRIQLPREHNYIRYFRQKKNHEILGNIYLARAQFDRALAEYKLRFKESPGSRIQKIIKQIESDSGALTPLKVMPAGYNPELELVFRNARTANVTVQKLDREKAVRKILDSLAGPKIRFELPALRVTRWMEDFKECIGPEVAKLELKLDPKAKHFETFHRFKLPVKDAGLYLVTVSFKGGWKTQMIVMLSQYSLTMAQISGQTNRLLLNDSVTGAPVPGQKIKFYFYKTIYAQNPAEIKKYGKIRIETKKFSATTGKDGSVPVPRAEGFLAATAVIGGKFVLYSGSGYQHGCTQEKYDRTSAFFITDRPIYKPGDTVDFSAFLRRASYSDETPLSYPASIEVRVMAPMGKTLYTKTMPVSRKTGAVSGRFSLPADAALGHYWISSTNRSFPGSVQFRVEEYKKPEFQVKVNLPGKPVKSGEPFTASIEANYYFGQPVAEAEVACKVYRERAVPYFPLVSLFDWLYGRGYVLPSTSFRWHFFPFYSERSLVGEFNGKTSEKGKFEFTVPTSGGKEKFGNVNYRYTVDAKLSDSSRREISANGEIFVIAKPFHVFVYPLRGFTGVNDQTAIRIAATDPNGRELSGRGVLKIFRMKLSPDGKYERDGGSVKSIRFESGETPLFRIGRSGVYEAFAEFHAKSGGTETGTCIFRVRGDSNPGELFSDLPLELSSDKSTYAPGDTAELLISSNKPGANVYLFVPGGMKIVKIGGYSAVVPFPIRKTDRPNIFVTALMIRDGVTTYLTKQLYVPPENKILNVKLNIPKTKIKPRSTVPVEVEISTLDGKPVSGAFAVTVYDKSLEGIARNNVPALTTFFWGWKRWSFSNFFNDLDQMSFPGNEPLFQWLIPGGREFSFGMGYMPCRMKLDISPVAPIMEKNYVRKSLTYKCKAPMAANSAESAGIGGDGVMVRSDFLDRAFWIGQRAIGSDGKVRFEVPVPDNLTTWVVKVWNLTSDTQVGEGNAEFIVSKDFIARLELPRFLVAGDETEARAIVHNYTDSSVRTSLNLISSSVGLECAKNDSTWRIPAGKSVTVPFLLRALAPCRTELTLTANAGKESDALRLPLTVAVRGAETSIPTTGRLSNQKATISFRIPSKIRRDTVKMSVSFAPGAATAMVDLLPYLAADDSSNVFGVVNRFLPALSAKYALAEMKVPFPEAVSGLSGRGELYKDYLRYGEKKPVFDAAKFERMIEVNLKMIQGMVNADGGWGWFSGYNETSWEDTTAYVTGALIRARKLGCKTVSRRVVDRALQWLERHAKKRRADILRSSSVSNSDALVLNTLAEGGKRDTELTKLVFKYRHQLAPYGMTLLALSMPAKTGDVNVILSELAQMVKTDAENGTAYLNLKPSWYFFWYGNDTSTQAEYLRLLMREKKSGKRIEALARYLTLNVRNAPSRSSVRALGDAVRALGEYAVFANETAPDLNLRLTIDGNEICTIPVTKENLWNGDLQIEIPSAFLNPGVHSLSITCRGRGAVYYDTMLTYFSLEDKIAPAGLEMRLERKYYRLERVDRETSTAGVGGRPQTLRQEEYKRIELKDLSTVAPGTLVEVELIAETKNDYDYVEFTDFLPAGFEYVKPVSGYLSWWPAIYAEYREQGPRFSQRSLGRGRNSIRYRIRAQLDGSYTARPAYGRGVYAPVLKTNTGYFRLGIK